MAKTLENSIFSVTTRDASCGDGQQLLDQTADDHGQDTGDPAASSSVTTRDDSCHEGQQQLPLQLLLTTTVEDKDRCGIIAE
jgi:hypothetical protein